MNFDFETFELAPNAARQYVDARAVFVAHEKAVEAAKAVRGGMVWVKSKGTEYLARTTTTGAQRGLGRRDERTEKIHSDFHARKSKLEDRVASLRHQLDDHVRMNRALRVGRMPPIAVRVLARINHAGLNPFLRTVGTHAMFAYETASGVRLPSEVMTTQDIDLLYDARRQLKFAVALESEAPSMLELLRKVDKTFVIDEQQRHTLVNDQGFQVDFLRRMQSEDDDHPIKLGLPDKEDVYVVQARRANELMIAPGFSEVVVASNGEMARIDTVHPAAFRDFKRWMSAQQDRDPLKRRRDRLQAEAVDQLLRERLAHLHVGEDASAIYSPAESLAMERTRLLREIQRTRSPSADASPPSPEVEALDRRIAALVGWQEHERLIQWAETFI